MSNPVFIGNATLYLGDSRDILPMLDGYSCCLTDSPYGDDYRSGHATDALFSISKLSIFFIVLYSSFCYLEVVLIHLHTNKPKPF